MKKSLTESTEEWIDSQQEWAGNPVHAPAISLLRLLAEQIDLDPNKASLISQYGLAYRSLLAERPKEEVFDDALDLLLRGQDA